ncbi:MAG TPA: alpha/beta hydrolase family protein, partial [Anaerolineae bacterium]
MPQFYTCQNAVLDRFEQTQRKLGYSAQNMAEHNFWREALRAKVRHLLGIDKFMPAPLNARVTDVVQCHGYRRERVEINTERGVTMPLYVLIPDGIKSAPAVIAAHGHDSGGKLPVAGVSDDPDVAARIRNYHYNYGEEAARQGYVVFCPDARGFG